MQDSAQALVEYALILALASVGVVFVLLILQDSIGATFQGTSTRLNAASTTPALPPDGGSAGGTETGAGAGGDRGDAAVPHDK